MKYEYCNEDYLKRLATDMRIELHSLKKSVQTNNRQVGEKAYQRLERFTKQVEHFEPIIKINAED